MPDVLLFGQFDGAFLHETVVKAYQVRVIGQGAVAREAFESCGAMKNCHLVLLRDEHMTFAWEGKRLLGVLPYQDLAIS